MYPDSLEALIESLMVLPGVGRKTAERYAFHLIEGEKDATEKIIASIETVNQSLTQCKICYNYADKEICKICSNQNRNHNIICVVSSPKDVFSIEKAGQFNGVYHVLKGLISTRKGVMPEDLTINELLKRIDENTEEVILALSATVEGETTALYVSKKLESMNAPVSRLAFGLPIGGQLEYTDDMTLMKAFEGRKRMK
ncbi:recombination protein RecR [Erysipelothrix larvae]|uniref:Recombination protein RecR n=1 Tax=Erysipelothrix larvae TaxID=1514105 RepID=A0A109UGB6_9FIRM|nr:recombination mediator RecR [Erysipelothrix larvae]AMC92443.1 recombination protein RecR [Erysipelothrix larvae]